MIIESKAILTEDQSRAMALVKKGKRHTLLYGGSRSGKTFLFVLVIVLRALIFKNSRHLIYRLRVKDAIESIWLETLPKVIEQFTGLNKLVKTNESRHVLTFSNGSEIWVAGVDDSRNADSVLGKEYITIYANEASQIPFLTAWKVRTRLAQKIPGCQAREFVDLNPTTKAHWTAKEFVEKLDPVHCKPGDKRPVHNPDEYCFLQLNPSGNKQNLDAHYLDALKNSPDSMKRRFYDGEYADDNELVVFPFPAAGFYAGEMFADWVKELGAQNIRFAAGLDIGFEDADGFCIIAYVPRECMSALVTQPKSVTGKRWLLYEYKARRTGLQDLAKEIQRGLDWARDLAAEVGMGSANIRIFSDTGGGGAKMVYDLRTVHGLPVLAAYKRDKLAAIELLQDEVKAGRFMVPADGAFAQEAEAIVWTKDPETGEVVRTIDDRQYHPDMMDSILYAMRNIWYSSMDIPRAK